MEKRPFQDEERLTNLIRGLAALGFSTADMSVMLSSDASAIDRRLRRLRGLKSVVGRPRNAVDRYVAVIRRYARLRVTAAESGAFKAEDVPLGDVLSAWLHEDEILIFCQGVLTTVEVATKPFWTTAQEGCVHFLCDVFGRPFHEIVVKPKQTDDARTLWHRYLSCVDTGLPPATSQQALFQSLTAVAFEPQRHAVIPVWGVDVFQRIDRLLDELSERDRELMCSLYGLRGREVQTIAQAGEAAIKMPTRIRTKKQKMLARLRVLAHQAQLDRLLQPLGGVLAREFALREKVERIRSQLLNLLPDG